MNARTLTALALTLLTAACGDSGPDSIIGPSPMPPTPTTWTGSVTETLTGATVQGWTAMVNGARVTVSAPGYVTRETTRNAAAIDLINESGFDIGFYRQMARGTLDGRTEPLRVLAQSPNVYLQTAGLNAGDVAALEQAARAVVPALTGDKLQVQTWETGETARTPVAGWITVTTVNDAAVTCGLTDIGTAAGSVRLNTAERCRFNGRTIDPPLFAHELGHALGFWHVDTPGHLMKQRATFAERTSVLPSDPERHHAAIAYSRPAGNRDIDIDPAGTFSTTSTRATVID